MRSCLLYSFLICTALVSAPQAHAQLLTGYDEPVQPALPVLPSPAPILTGPSTVIQPRPMQVAPSPSVYRPLMTYGDAPATNTGQGEPVDFDADNLSYDEQTRIVSASGDVFLKQSGRILRADQMAYNLSEDKVDASGYVVLNEENGDVYLADTVRYQNKLRDGNVQNLRSVLNDGSRFKAEEGELQGGNKTVMRSASYTPCEICGDEDAVPLWGIRASEVVHDKLERTISYEDARFEVKGVPVMYTPYFSHSDGTIKQESGFLSPSIGYRSDLGAFVETNYYWAIGPDQDATIGMIAATNQAPLGVVEYRRRWNDADLDIDGSFTYSERTNTSSGVTTREEEELRGHAFAKARWDINNKWRSGVNLSWVSDKQYLRQYDFDNEDVLENEIYVERFSGRNYLNAGLVAFKDTRIREQPLDQPDILPEITASFKGEPGGVPLLKGRWGLDASVLGVRREGDEQDVNRLSLDANWMRRLISDYGLLTSVEASVRGDVYYSNDRTDAAAGSGRSRSSTDLRAFPQFHIQTSYPMAREFEKYQASIEPIVSLTAAPRIDVNGQIPNEDSNDAQIDASNLFERNRFPGLDRVEDDTRATYGLRTGLYGYDGSYGSVFVGQSYRFDDEQNPFPRGSGLETQESDVVGQISGNYKDRYTLDYRFQLDSRQLTSQRHEVDAYADWNRFRLGAQYLFAKSLEGTDIDDSRDQLKSNAQFYMTPDWRLRSGATYDLGEDEGLRETYFGLDYLGQCLFFSLTGEKNFTRESSGDSGTEILFRIGLKNLGDFEESGYREEDKAINQACALSGL